MIGSVRIRILLLASATTIGLALPCHSDEPIIPPSVSKISPAGMERGKTVAFTIEGRNLADATEVIFDAAGMSGKVTGITDVPEEIKKAIGSQARRSQGVVGSG